MKSIILSAMLLFLLSGCTRIYYLSNAQNVPMLTERNETRLIAAVSSGDEYHAIDFQAAYSPIKHLGMLVSGSFGALESKNMFNIHQPNTGRALDFAVGGYIFYPVTQRSKQYLFFADAYTGLGNGTVNYAWSYDTIAPLNYHRWYLQLSGGLKHKHVEFALSNRVSIAKYNNINEIEIHHSYYQYLSVPRKNTNYCFTEPAITLRLGFPAIMFQVQLAGCYLLSGQDLGINKNNFQMGIFLTPSVLFSKQKNLVMDEIP